MIHKQCGNEMQPLVSGSHVASSEWYCHPCHKSQLMDEDEARKVLMQQAQMAAAAMQGTQKR